MPFVHPLSVEIADHQQHSCSSPTGPDKRGYSDHRPVQSPPLGGSIRTRITTAWHKGPRSHAEQLSVRRGITVNRSGPQSRRTASTTVRDIVGNGGVDKGGNCGKERIVFDQCPIPQILPRSDWRTSPSPQRRSKSGSVTMDFQWYEIGPTVRDGEY